jgi:hypothetical protein
MIIIVNAIFLQSGMHPAPFFTNPTALNQPATSPMAPAANRSAATATLATPPPAPPINTVPTRTPDRATETPARAAPPGRTPASAHRNDPIGDLIGGGAPSSTSSVGSPRIIAMQRVLSEFGYGQLRLTGTVDEPTSVAIQKFEAEHQLPVTGRVSERLINEIAAMTGHAVQ